MEESTSGRGYELSLSKGFGNGGEYKCVNEDGREGALSVIVHGKSHVLKARRPF